MATKRTILSFTTDPEARNRHKAVAAPKGKSLRQRALEAMQEKLERDLPAGEELRDAPHLAQTSHPRIADGTKGKLDAAEDVRTLRAERVKTIGRERQRVAIDASLAINFDWKEFDSLGKASRESEARGDSAAAVAAYEAAADLYRGDFLENEPFAEWCQQDRECLRVAYLNVIRKLSGLLGSLGDWDRSIRHLRAGLRVDSLREELHRSLMYALWASGRRDEAARQYRVCADLLQRELGIPPLPETRRLFQRLLSSPAP